MRASQGGEDEIGLLTEAFNHMLEQSRSGPSRCNAPYDEVEARCSRPDGRTREGEQGARGLCILGVARLAHAPLRAITGLAEILLKSPAGRAHAEARRVWD
ncbi:MAG: hypothetical protein WDM96_07050 [Lacunisphaera sp.]